jgi:cation diffusion facilitator family transporter
MSQAGIDFHSHVFLAEGHERSERKTWLVIALCGAMMIAEIIGGFVFGSIALVADGLHMSTHAGALLLAALAYTLAREYAHDPRFTFGTGKLGDLAGFTSAIILAMIAILIGYESAVRFLDPVPIRFAEAIPIACAGLAVNIASAWLLSGGHHDHSHGHAHNRAGHHHDASKPIAYAGGVADLEVFEDGAPPRFRLRAVTAPALIAQDVSIETVRADGLRQLFHMEDRDSYLESAEEIPEPHAFTAYVRIGGRTYSAVFEEHEHAHASAHRDNNMQAAVIHVLADAMVSVLVIAGLLLAWSFAWLWMDPLAGIVGACVIASWSYGLIRDTGAILIDMNPDRRMAESVRTVIESDGDRLTDLHLWRLGPGHIGAIIAVRTQQPRGPGHYRARLARFRSLSHVTVEVERDTHNFPPLVPEL